MKLMQLGVITSMCVGATAFAQLAEVAELTEFDVNASRVRLPQDRSAPDVAAAFIQLSAARLLPSSGGFNTAGYVEPAPPQLLAGDRWQVSADGRSVLAVELFADGAESLRVKFDPGFDRGIELFVFDPRTGSAFGPYTTHQLARTEWWSTIIFGDSIGLEFVYNDSANPPPVPSIGSIAYGTEPPPPASQGCMHRDASCDPAWANSADSVALLATLNDDDELQTFCSGALLNRQPGDRSPLVMTANHCISSQSEAGRSVYVWFYETDSCNGNDPDPNDLPRSEGSLLLKRYTDSDWTLVGLYEPPATGWYLGWSTGYWDDDTPATGIHHPRGDFKRISFGEKIDESDQCFCPGECDDCDCQGCFFAEVWDVDFTTGFVQPGSSGSPVMSSVGVMRGTLTGGNTCDTSRYGRFDLAYENLRYYLGNSYIASPVYVNRGAGGDPGNNGNSERGTSGQPFNTVYEATFAVRSGDRVRITPGTYNERMTIWRPMRLERSGTSGIVRIGG